MSFLIFQKLAEERIQEAIRNGEFDDLPGKGQPLQMEDLSFVPEEVRLAYKVLKNAGFVPPELELRREIRSLEDLLESLGEEEMEEQYRIMRRLDFLLLKLREVHRRSILLEEDSRYYRLVAQKVARLREKERRSRSGRIDWYGLSHRLGLKYLAGTFRRRA
ncbi:MAG: DUF1992 domain-containing protein [Thermodesulfatator sp.]|nr:MAG: DUF1992 domain-containing protein [Thermodesulfatator sp.]